MHNKTTEQGNKKTEERRRTEKGQKATQNIRKEGHTVAVEARKTNTRGIGVKYIPVNKQEESNMGHDKDSG